MRDIKLELTFAQRQNVLAARKPYESFSETLDRLLQEMLNTVPKANNVKALRRSDKQWRIPTEEGNRERDFELYVEGIRSMGFKDSLKSLREQYEDSREFEDDELAKDPRSWEHESDVDDDVVYGLVMKKLRARRKGNTFKLYDLIDKACPKVHSLPGSAGRSVLDCLLQSPQFMRSVRHVEGQGYFNLKLQKL
jgi:hypothetical protein